MCPHESAAAARDVNTAFPQPSQKGSSFTSFSFDQRPEDEIQDISALGGFYNKVRSVTSAAASGLMDSVQPKTSRGRATAPLGTVDQTLESLPWTSDVSNASSKQQGERPSVNRVEAGGHKKQAASIASITPSLLSVRATAPSLAPVTIFRNQDSRSPVLSSNSSFVEQDYLFSSKKIGHGHQKSLSTSTVTHEAEHNHLPGFKISREPSSDSASFQSSDTVNDKRTFSNNLRRLQPGGLSKDFWMKDENCTQCFSCNATFNPFRRKHHCRKFLQFT